MRSVRSVCYKINYPWVEITDPLYLPLKWGGLVCPPLESPMISNGPDGKSVYPCAKNIRVIRSIRVQNNIRVLRYIRLIPFVFRG